MQNFHNCYSCIHHNYTNNYRFFGKYCRVGEQFIKDMVDCSSYEAMGEVEIKEDQFGGVTIVYKSKYPLDMRY